FCSGVGREDFLQRSGHSGRIQCRMPPSGVYPTLSELRREISQPERSKRVRYRDERPKPLWMPCVVPLPGGRTQMPRRNVVTAGQLRMHANRGTAWLALYVTAGLLRSSSTWSSSIRRNPLGPLNRAISARAKSKSAD
ncbi:MAG: hypothetical protein ACOC0P_05820, partial [Planctomycetota bacterium]